MRGHSNVARGLTSPERGGTTGNNNSTHLHSCTKNNKSSHHNDNHYQHGSGGGGSGSSGTGHDEKKGVSSDTSIVAVWPPKFVIALTNKEKEEDFMAIKGSKLPQRPKKRAKLIQRTLNVSPLLIRSLLVEYLNLCFVLSIHEIGIFRTTICLLC